MCISLPLGSSPSNATDKDNLHTGRRWKYVKVGKWVDIPTVDFSITISVERSSSRCAERERSESHDRFLQRVPHFPNCSSAPLRGVYHSAPHVLAFDPLYPGISSPLGPWWHSQGHTCHILRLFWFFSVERENFRALIWCYCS